MFVNGLVLLMARPPLISPPAPARAGLHGRPNEQEQNVRRMAKSVDERERKRQEVISEIM